MDIIIQTLKNVLNGIDYKGFMDRMIDLLPAEAPPELLLFTVTIVSITTFILVYRCLISTIFTLLKYTFILTLVISIAYFLLSASVNVDVSGNVDFQRGKERIERFANRVSEAAQNALDNLNDQRHQPQSSTWKKRKVHKSTSNTRQKIRDAWMEFVPSREEVYQATTGAKKRKTSRTKDTWF